MSWSTPKTWTAGAVTAAEMNAELRDNLAWLKAALAEHGITSDSVVGALLSARYGASMEVSGRSVADASDVAINFDTSDEEWDDAAFHDGVNRARFTIPTDGTYAISAFASFAANSTGRREAWIEKNGTDEYNRVRHDTSGGAAPTGIYTAVEVECSAGDYFIMRCRQASGTSLDVDARFQIRRIAA